MDLALQIPCIKQRFKRELNLEQIAVNGNRRVWLSSSMGISRRGSVCCKKQSDERSSTSSKLKQKEIISLFKRIQLSISKEESQEVEEMKKKNSDEGSENKPLSKAILDVIEKPKKKTDIGAKEPQERQLKVARPQSSFSKRSPVRPSTPNPRGKLPESKKDVAIQETTEKEEKAPLIERMKLAELKEVAKNKGIKGYSKLKKSELIQLIRSS